jgi:hypothetical protein
MIAGIVRLDTARSSPLRELNVQRSNRGTDQNASQMLFRTIPYFYAIYVIRGAKPGPRPAEMP